MSRTPVVLCFLLVAAGCRLPEREAVIKPLPEGQSYTYQELLARARTQATAALEAFYVDNWTDIEDTAAALEQTARFLPKTTEMPAGAKDRIGPETEQLRQDALKLGDAARTKNARAVNEVLQRINARIRELRVDEKLPPPIPPVKTNPAP